MVHSKDGHHGYILGENEKEGSIYVLFLEFFKFLIKKIVIYRFYDEF